MLRRVRASAPDGSNPRGYVRLVESGIGSSCSEANPVLLFDWRDEVRRVRGSAPDGSSPRGYVRLVESGIGSSCSKASPHGDGLIYMVQPPSVGCMASGKKGLRRAGRSPLDEVVACGREAVDEDLLTCLQFPAKPVYVQPPNLFSYIVGPAKSFVAGRYKVSHGWSE